MQDYREAGTILLHFDHGANAIASTTFCRAVKIPVATFGKLGSRKRPCGKVKRSQPLVSVLTILTQCTGADRKAEYNIERGSPPSFGCSIGHAFPCLS